MKLLSQLKTSLLLLVWLLLGIGLRFTNLAAKPPWTDEFCTLVFSMGNSFHSVPLNTAIALDVLLQPLQPNPEATVAHVWQHLLTESNHPPLYFLLAHWWMQLWQPDGSGIASIWAGRSLSAFFGAASIPAIYGLAWFAFRSQLISHLAAAMMAVSPYGIFLAQEARHYTLAILWVIPSLTCLVIAICHIQDGISLPKWLIASWISINFLGISTHYFFSLTLCTQAFVLVTLWLRRQDSLRIQPQGVDKGDKEDKEEKMPKISPAHLPLCPRAPVFPSPWWQIFAVAVSTLVGCLVWLPVFLHNSYGDDLTAWIQSNDNSAIAWFGPIFQAIAAWITMISLLPVEATAVPAIATSGGIMLIFLIWTLPILRRGFVTTLQQPATALMTQVLAKFVLGAIALFFFFTYALHIDLTRGARYNFVYFPAVIVLLGASLAVTWHTSNQGRRKQKFFVSGKKAVAIILLMGFFSAITVICNLGYQKYYRPDTLVQLIQGTSHSPILIATTQKTHVQIGEMMGIAREFKLLSEARPLGTTARTLTKATANPLFLFAHLDENSHTSTAVQQTLNNLSGAIDLWLVNFYAPFESNDCVADSLSLPPVDGYNYQLFHCDSSTLN